MGNCSMKGTTGECHHSIRVMCDSGAILQLKAPKTVAQVLQHYPGYGIFRQGHASAPLPEQESLSYDLFYYLLPLKEVQVEHQKSCCDKVQQVVQRSEEMCKSAACDYVENLSNGSALEVLPTAKNGVWRVDQELENMSKMQTQLSCSTTSPSPSRSPSPTTSSKKVGWKTTLFNGKIAKDTIPVPAPAGSNLYLGSC
ncbi:hypothetical protein glysoja_017583 [Glycine soja]|nr:hypothetical protein glysoja_017583 [Glycine soja]